MSEEQNNNFFVSLPPYNNCSCFVPYNSSLISSSPINTSNTTENNFFIVHDDIHYPIFSVDYRMDQHERCGLKSFHMISPMDFSCCFLNIRAGPSPFLISEFMITYNDVCPNLYKEEVLDLSKRSDWEVGVCYVMLCIMYSYSSILIYRSLMVYKLYDIPYSMLCYFGGM